jgi:hypothetical protein
MTIAAADVGAARGAHLPMISGGWQAVRDETRTDVIGHPDQFERYVPKASR